MGSQNKFKKFPSISRLGHSDNDDILSAGDIVVQEKLDGANFRFTWSDDEDRLVFGSKNIEYWNEKDTDKTFVHAVDFVRSEIDKSKIVNMQNVYGSVTVFGEAMHKHTLSYGTENHTSNAIVWENVPNAVFFDVWTEKRGFLDWETAKQVIESFDLPTVPVMYTGPATDWNVPTEDDEFPESAYRDGKPEGVIVKNTLTGQRAKHRTTAFKEAHQNKSVVRPNRADSDDSIELAYKFTTEQRVLKHIHKYEDRDEAIEMPLMETLWRDVFQDVLDEEYETIFCNDYTINTAEFRSQVASITATVLENYIENPHQYTVTTIGDDEN